MNVLDLEALFGPGGPLSKNLPYYEYRPSQIEYARAVQSAFDEKKIALVEAQTGTGKTLAYLIPALQTGRRVIISTGTKALQEQLVFKDIPLIREKLGIEFESLLMKGRMNYLCLLKQERLETEPLLPDQESVGHFETIRKWSSETDTGDLAESGVPEMRRFSNNSPFLPMPASGRSAVIQSVFRIQGQATCRNSASHCCKSSFILC